MQVAVPPDTVQFGEPPPKVSAVVTSVGTQLGGAEPFTVFTWTRICVEFGETNCGVRVFALPTFTVAGSTIVKFVEVSCCRGLVGLGTDAGDAPPPPPRQTIQPAMRVG